MDPEHRGLLSEILQMSTMMPVLQIENDMEVRPNANLTIQKGILSLEEPSRLRGMRLPIDHFSRALALDQGSRAVGILLSGMGYGGVLGLSLLKANLGAVMFQDTITAEFPSMPRSVIVSGLTDYIAPADKLTERLFSYIQSCRSLSETTPEEKRYTNARTKILALIRSWTGEDYSMFKESLIRDQIERRMGLYQIGDNEEYVRYIQEHPEEIDILAQEIPAGPNWFFRNPGIWGILRERLLSELIRTKPDGTTLRVWVPGCATGEQTYSMAIMLEETIRSSGRENDIQYQIFATDIDRERILEAREGTYVANIEVDVSLERLERFFIKRNNTYQIRQEIRGKTIFAQHNVLNHPPFLHLDILDVRGLLMYMSPDLVQKLLPLFQYALNPGGILILGINYTAGEPPDHFEPIDRTRKIYRQIPSPGGYEIGMELPCTFTPPSRQQEDESGSRNESSSIAAHAREWLLAHYAPPAVIVNEDGDILYFQGRTGKYLEPYPGRATLNVYAMARRGLRYPLTSAIRTAIQERCTATRGPVFVETNGGEEAIHLTVRPIRLVEGAEDLLMVIFEPVPGPASKTGHGENTTPKVTLQSDLDKELVETRAQLQRTIEDMQASQEELQSTNEELKSTNEELTSSKEELQSLNEELLTVNAEHQRKIEELSENNDDMRNLLQITNIAMLFLDNDLRVRRFTDLIRPITSLQPGDVGRPITDLWIGIRGEDLVGDVRAVLDTLQIQTRQVQAEDGRWYLMRILPYRTTENRIEGVIITFNDVTPIKEMEDTLEEAWRYVENLIAIAHEPLLMLDAELRVIFANRSFYTAFQVTQEETEGNLIYTLGNQQWNIPRLRRLLEEILPQQTKFDGFLVEHDFPTIGHRVMRLNARVFHSDVGPDQILLAIEDVTGRREEETTSV